MISTLLTVGLWHQILNEKDQLREDYDDILEEKVEGTIHPPMDFLHGWCTHYAYELSKKYGYTIVALRDICDSLVHTFCIMTDTDNITWYIDIRGATNDKKIFFDEFEIDLDYPDDFFWDEYSPLELEEFAKDYKVDQYDHDLEAKKVKQDAITFVNLFSQEWD